MKVKFRECGHAGRNAMCAGCAQMDDIIAEERIGKFLRWFFWITVIVSFLLLPALGK